MSDSFYCSHCRRELESVAAIEIHNRRVAVAGERTYRKAALEVPITVQPRPVAIAREFA